MTVVFLLPKNVAFVTRQIVVLCVRRGFGLSATNTDISIRWKRQLDHTYNLTVALANL